MNYRILDANYNRSREALRVVEDAARFYLNDKQIALIAKQLRHKLGSLFSTHQMQLLGSRNIRRDVLKETDFIEKPRDHSQIVMFNFQRLQESLRSIEEYSKETDIVISRNAHNLRFQSYDLEKQMMPKLFKKRIIDDARLYLIIPLDRSPRLLFKLTKDAIKGGVDIIQLRAVNLADKEFISIAGRLRRLTEDTDTGFIINNRVDIALATKADGVHLGLSDTPLEHARKILGNDKIIGMTTHNKREVRIVLKGGADYISYGPVFLSPTKPHLKPAGFSYLSFVKSVQIPFFAIGGIRRLNINELLRRGVKRVAVSSGIIDAPDVIAEARKMKRLLLSL